MVVSSVLDRGSIVTVATAFSRIEQFDWLENPKKIQCLTLTCIELLLKSKLKELEIVSTCMLQTLGHKKLKTRFNFIVGALVSGL